jgi:hypothetical protein
LRGVTKAQEINTSAQGTEVERDVP